MRLRIWSKMPKNMRRKMKNARSAFATCVMCALSLFGQDKIEAVDQAQSVLHETESKMEEFRDQLPSDEVNVDSVIVQRLLL